VSTPTDSTLRPVNEATTQLSKDSDSVRAKRTATLSLSVSWRIVPLIWVAFWIASCNGPDGSPSVPVDTTAILLVNVGERVQAEPHTEALKIAFSEAMELAQTNGNDLGYPWIDPSSGELVLSAVTQRGRDLLEAAANAVPHRIRIVGHGTAELRRIQDEATFLHSQGVPGANLIYETLPDHRDNRTLLVIRARSDALLEVLASRYPAGTLAVEVNPDGR